MLQGAFGIEKIEQSVADYGSTYSPSVLRALKWFRKPGRCGQGCGQCTVSESAKSLPMDGIRTRPRRDTNRTGAGQFGREIQA